MTCAPTARASSATTSDRPTNPPNRHRARRDARTARKASRDRTAARARGPPDRRSRATPRLRARRRARASRRSAPRGNPHGRPLTPPRHHPEARRPRGAHRKSPALATGWRRGGGGAPVPRWLPRVSVRARARARNRRRLAGARCASRARAAARSAGDARAHPAHRQPRRIDHRQRRVRGDRGHRRRRRLALPDQPRRRTPSRATRGHPGGIAVTGVAELVAPPQRFPVRRRWWIALGPSGLGALLVVTAILGFVIAIAGGGLGCLGGGSSGPGPAPSGAAVSDIPPAYLRLYEQAGQRFDIDWAFLASIGAQESDHGRAPGTFTVNYAGAAGPMQICVRSCGEEWQRWAVDGDGDGTKSEMDPADAIFTAARILREEKGAPPTGRGYQAYSRTACRYS